VAWPQAERSDELKETRSSVLNLEFVALLVLISVHTKRNLSHTRFCSDARFLLKRHLCFASVHVYFNDYFLRKSI
jgi:hypothetical protein